MGRGSDGAVVGLVVRPRCPARGFVPVSRVPLACHFDDAFDVSDLRFGVAVALRVVGCGCLAGGVNSRHQPGPRFTCEGGAAVADYSAWQAAVLCK